MKVLWSLDLGVWSFRARAWTRRVRHERVCYRCFRFGISARGDGSFLGLGIEAAAYCGQPDSLVNSIPKSPSDERDTTESSKERASRPRSQDGSLSRRGFLASLGVTAISTAALGATNVAKGLAEANAETVHGPGMTPVAFTVNGEKRTFAVEPRMTLLEVLRTQAGLTGAKESCDRATCGACTVLLDGTPVYACSMLAIEARGSEITTIEGLVADGALTKLQQAMVDHDGVQCGYCSPGMVMVLTALLRKNPHPSEAEVRAACAGNLCRCGSYPRIFAAALDASGQAPANKVTVLAPHEHGLRDETLARSATDETLTRSATGNFSHEHGLA